MAKAQATKTENKFQVDDHIVYPSHGVGRIVGIEKQEIAGLSLELYVVDFEREKMKLRVPLTKVEQVGMRALSTETHVEKALTLLNGKARVKRTMWSRRAQEYEGKINSGDLISVAEVVRDLYRSDSQPDQSYSERQLFEAALDRMIREISVIQQITETEARNNVMKAVDKNTAKKVAQSDETADKKEKDSAEAAA